MEIEKSFLEPSLYKGFVHSIMTSILHKHNHICCPTVPYVVCPILSKFVGICNQHCGASINDCTFYFYSQIAQLERAKTDTQALVEEVGLITCFILVNLVKVHVGKT